MIALDAFFAAVAMNAVLATLLALVVAASSRKIRRPGLLHALWLLVLLKLASPPLLELGFLPAPDTTTPAPEEAAARAALAGSTPTEALHASSVSTVRSGVDGRLALLGVWLAVSFGLLALALHRARQFHRVARSAREAPPSIRRAIAELTPRLGLKRAPGVRLVDAAISPLLWAPGNSLVVLLPAQLLDRLERNELEALLAHELAHVKRRDHWHRWLELLATTLFWWHPVTWWARRNLRDAEERCCDVRVLESLPTHSRAYAEGLLKTAEFLVGERNLMPGLACGAGEAGALRERLTMILERRTPPSLSPLHRSLMLLGALAVLFSFPAARESALQAAGAAVRDSPPDLEARAERTHAQLLSLERRQVELEEEMQRLQAQRLHLELELHEDRAAQERERADAHLAQLEAAGSLEEAARLRREVELHQRRQELERRAHRLEQGHLEAGSELEARARRARLEAMQLELAGEHQSADALRAEAAQLEGKLNRLEAATEQGQLAVHREMLQAELLRAQEERGRLVEAGRDDEARHLDSEISARQREAHLRQMELELRDGGRAQEEHARELELQEARLAERARELELELAEKALAKQRRD